MSHGKKNIYIPSPHSVCSADQCGPAQRNTEEVREQADTSIAIRQSHLTSCKSSDSLRSPVLVIPAGSAEQSVPCAWPCPSPAPRVFCLLLQAWNYPQRHSKTVSFHVSRHMLPFCERLFQPVCQQTPVLPSRLSTCLFCPAGPLSSKSSLPALCNRLPTDTLPSKSSLGFRNQGHAFCI